MEQPLPPLPPHRQLVAAAQLGEPLLDGRCLFAHQRAAVRWLLARRGAVLADAMGLGKTLTALVAARALVRLADCRILVIAPVGLHGHWQSEAAALGLQLELHSWARLPPALPPAGTVLIADEAHFAQNGQTRRSQGLLRLARHPRLRAIWLLTGTPMKNGRPAQLFPLLAAIGHPLARDQRAFEEYFCQGHWREQAGRRLWQASGASHLEELQRLVRPLVLHRRKQDCLDLPPKRRQLWPVELAGPQARGFQHRLQSKVDDYRRRAARGEVRRDGEVLAVLTALRQIGSDYKLPATRELVAGLLSQGEAVVVFTAFVATAELLHRSFAASSLLTGALPPAQRQGQVDAFQRGEQPLLIALWHRRAGVHPASGPPCGAGGAALDPGRCGTGGRPLSPHRHGRLSHLPLAATGGGRSVGRWADRQQGREDRPAFGAPQPAGHGAGSAGSLVMAQDLPRRQSS